MRFQLYKIATNPDFTASVGTALSPRPTLLLLPSSFFLGLAVAASRPSFAPSRPEEVTARAMAVVRIG